MKPINNNITETLVSFETAKLLKEKGFAVKCCNWYDQTQGLNPFDGIRGAMVYLKEADAPTQQLSIDWLRINFNIHIAITSIDNSGLIQWKYFISDAGANIGHSERFKSIEICKEEAIKYCLTNLIK